MSGKKTNGGQDLSDMTNADATDAPAPADNSDKLVQLNAELDDAYTARDTKRIVQIATAIAKMEKSIENAEIDAKQNALKDITLEVRDAIRDVINAFIEAGKLEVAQGVWISWDFGTNDLDVALLKKTVRAVERKSTGGGHSTKNLPTTADLMSEYGDTMCELSGFDGMTFQQAHDANNNGNKRYRVRQAMLKLGGHI